MDIVSSLKLIKECTTTILKELQSIQHIKKFNATHFSTYSKAITLLGDSIDRIITIFGVKKAPEEHVQLKLLMVDFLGLRVLQFKQHISDYKEWCDKLEHGNYWSKCCGMICDSPSKQQAKLEIAFQSCFDSIREMIALEGTLLGSAIRIKHPILRRVWLQAGQNDLNATEICVSLLQDSLWQMLRHELKQIKNEKFCKDMICALVNRLDGSLGSKPDGKISMMELNEAAKFPKDSVADLLGITIEKQPDEHTMETDCKVSFEGPIFAENNCGFDIPAIKNGRYGSDWNNKTIAQITVPEVDGEYFGVKVCIEGNDQGWGNTNQVQISYYVDRGDAEIITHWAMNFNHDQVKDEKYSFMLYPENVKQGETISLFLYVPPWQGFSGKVTKVSAVCIMQKHKEIASVKEHTEPPVSDKQQSKKYRACF